MNGSRKKLRLTTVMLLAMTLLAISLLFSACAHNKAGSGAGSTLPKQQQSSSTTTPGTSGGSSGDLEGINQDIQDAVQAVDASATDVADTDANAATENGSDPQP